MNFLVKGAKVRLEGFQSEAGRALNGKTGEIFEEQEGERFGVRIDGVGNRSIKRANLVVVEGEGNDLVEEGGDTKPSPLSWFSVNPDSLSTEDKRAARYLFSWFPCEYLFFGSVCRAWRSLYPLAFEETEKGEGGGGGHGPDYWPLALHLHGPKITSLQAATQQDIGRTDTRAEWTQTVMDEMPIEKRGNWTFTESWVDFEKHETPARTLHLDPVIFFNDGIEISHEEIIEGELPTSQVANEFLEGLGVSGSIPRVEKFLPQADHIRLRMIITGAARGGQVKLVRRILQAALEKDRDPSRWMYHPQFMSAQRVGLEALMCVRSRAVVEAVRETVDMNYSEEAWEQILAAKCGVGDMSGWLEEKGGEVSEDHLVRMTRAAAGGGEYPRASFAR
uniref:Uncharacterized protein n=1 Tax=Chromera velia CCMP2878 TaxID=1169474 RepID=A0A0G4GRP3_9ALVE|eukprot:Cvel_5109.t1-p1 / transcript=Cvel_5109.t1 / gene=Cvel_5109 / organism=Chromera_velia_CCMP2878 / gene_product=hypothetical protein / transcript_product=hypothetical protein / location=Cvel_scaffold233:95388-96560(-) / protein_length=391 / sequence_SO=supercontig / SO=protein_coding / is_pseudo=false